MKARSIYAIIAIFLLAPLTANAAGYNSNNGKIRSGKTEYSFKINYLNSWDIDGENASRVELDTDISFGFEVGYNYSEHLKFSYEFSYNSPNYSATTVIEDGEEQQEETVLSNNLDILNSQFNVIYNFSAGKFTPFIGAGAGWAYMNSNISNEYSGTFCFWDPWLGYVCSGGTTSYDSFNFAYNAKVGLRYDLDKSLYVNTAYVQNWYDFSHAKTATAGQIQIEVGMKF